jgi:hypothetical protein
MEKKYLKVLLFQGMSYALAIANISYIGTL